MSNLPALSLILLIFLALILIFASSTHAIQCFSGSQLQIIECSSVSCIKQSMGLDTVRYCDGAGVSSICQTYGLLNSCQDLPNMGKVCCCGEDLCNSALRQGNTIFCTIISTALLLFWRFV